MMHGKSFYVLYKAIHNVNLSKYHTMYKDYPKYINDHLLKIRSIFLNGSKKSNKTGIFQY